MTIKLFKEIEIGEKFNSFSDHQIYIKVSDNFAITIYFDLVQFLPSERVYIEK